MLYLLETKLSDKKSIFFALTQIYGINKSNAFLICKKSGFSSNLKVNKLTQEQIQEMLVNIDSLNFSLNMGLKILKSQILKKLISIKTYRGLRLVRRLPVRGQRTHTNAKSARKNKLIL